MLPDEVLPGGAADISIAMKAPTAPGTYQSEWKLSVTGSPLIGVGPDGTIPLSVQIVVGSAPCAYKITFVADVTIPDNTVMKQGAAFEKTWRLRNDGTCAWGKDYALSSLAFIGGNPLGAPEGVALPINVPPGSTADISVSMTAPVTPGIYRSEWKLAGTDLLFGVGANDAPLYVQIVVAESYLATPIADSPAAGICASIEGDRVEVQIYPDLPDPRCVKVRANQTLTLHNQTTKPVEFTLAQFNVRLEPGQAYTIDRPFGDYLAPGVHRVLVLPYSGPELWLE